jgi:hypothetical protein
VWSSTQIHFEMLDDLSQDPVATLRIETPAGVLPVMADRIETGNGLIARGLHINGEGTDFGPGALGVANLRIIVRAFMERFDYDELVIEGAVRSSGRRAGNRPRSIRFARRRLAFGGR